MVEMKDITTVAVVVLVVALVIPIAINIFGDVDTSGWDANLVLIWDIIPLFALLGIGIGFIYKLTKKN
jgi:uncharacterized BrkB/YihY/UPF0761 family membrane protein